MSTQFSIGGSGGLENSDSSRRRSAQSSSDISFESVLSDRIHSLDKADPIKINDAIPKEYAELSDRINEIMHSATEEQHKRMGAGCVGITFMSDAASISSNSLQPPGQELKAKDAAAQKKEVYQDHARAVLEDSLSTKTKGWGEFHKDKALAALDALAHSADDHHVKHSVEALMSHIQDASKHELSHLEHLHRLLEASFKEQEGSDLRHRFDSAVMVQMSQKCENPFKTENPFAPKVPQVSKPKEAKPTDNFRPKDPQPESNSTPVDAQGMSPRRSLGFDQVL